MSNNREARPAPAVEDALDDPDCAVVSVCDLHMDQRFHEVVRADQFIALTRLEFRLLFLLMRRVNQVVSYAELLAYAWGYSSVTDATDLLKSPISRLRTKINLRAPGRLRLVSVSRRGYMLTIV